MTLQVKRPATKDGLKFLYFHKMVNYVAVRILKHSYWCERIFMLCHWMKNTTNTEHKVESLYEDVCVPFYMKSRIIDDLFNYFSSSYYFLSAYHVSGIVLGSGDKWKIRKTWSLISFMSYLTSFAVNSLLPLKTIFLKSFKKLSHWPRMWYISMFMFSDSLAVEV